eukprot:661281-Prymnesium_polylepis.4
MASGCGVSHRQRARAVRHVTAAADRRMRVARARGVWRSGRAQLHALDFISEYCVDCFANRFF